MEASYWSSVGTGALPYGHVHVYPPAGGEASVNQLDLLFFSLTVLTVVHAWQQKRKRKEHLTLALSGFLLGLSTEQASLRFGGTHCHASGLVHFHEVRSDVGNIVVHAEPTPLVLLSHSPQYALLWMAICFAHHSAAR